MGTLWINIPVLVIMLIVGVSFAVLLGFLTDGTKFSAVFVFVGACFSGCGSAWLYWSVMIPRWRIWSLRRVADWEKLVKLSTNQVIWPSGCVFEHTEIWTAKQREIAGELSQARTAERNASATT
ncbi:MAG TPA: hypothetical protein VGG36_07065 [Rhizomicrobium sp.]